MNYLTKICFIDLDCTETQSNGIVTTMTVGNSSFQYNCFYFVTPANATSVQLEFTFTTYLYYTYAYLSNVTLNSTSNLIENGNFETYQYINNTDYQYTFPPWNISGCGSLCEYYPAYLDYIPVNDTIGLTAVNLKLSQTVALNTVGNQSVYQLIYWFRCLVYDDPTAYCSYTVKLTTT